MRTRFSFADLLCRQGLQMKIWAAAGLCVLAVPWEIPLREMAEWLDETVTTQVKIFQVFSHVMVDLGRETVIVKASFRGGKKPQPKQVEKWVFCPFLQVFSPIAAACFCPHPGGAVSVFTWHCTWCSSLVLPPFDPLINFFHFHLGRNKRFGGEREAISF